MCERKNICNLKVSDPQKRRVPPPLFCTDLEGGYTPLLSKNYTPPKNLQISVKIEKWARFGMAAHLCLGIEYPY